MDTVDLTAAVESGSSTPSSSSDRPSFGAALETAERTVSGTPPPVQSPDTTVPADASVPLVTSPVVGEPPPERWPQILENARKKERADVLAEVQQTHGNLTQLTAARSFYTEATTDPAAFTEKLLAAQLRNPQSAPAIRSMAARILGQGRHPSPPAPAVAPRQTTPPQADFTDGQGNEFYSAKAMQQYGAHLKADILQQLQPQIQPLQEERARNEQARHTVEIERAMTTWRDTTLTEARAWPYFADHKEAIKAELLKMPKTSGHPAEEALALRKAYDRVVLPKLRQLEHDRLQADYQRQAHASTLNPASSSVPANGLKKAKESWAGAFEYAESVQRGR